MHSENKTKHFIFFNLQVLTPFALIYENLDPTRPDRPASTLGSTRPVDISGGRWWPEALAQRSSTKPLKMNVTESRNDDIVEKT